MENIRNIRRSEQLKTIFDAGDLLRTNKTSRFLGEPEKEKFWNTMKAMAEYAEFLYNDLSQIFVNNDTRI